jgi:hypothetical protein
MIDAMLRIRAKDAGEKPAKKAKEMTEAAEAARKTC